LCLESKFLEEPLVSTSRLGSTQMFLLEDLLEVLLRLNQFVLVLHIGRVDHILQVDVHRVARRHHMLQIDTLDERLDVGPLQNLLLGHALGDLARIPLDSSHEHVSKLSALGTLLETLYDNSLLTSLTAIQDHNHFARLQTNPQVSTAPPQLHLQLHHDSAIVKMTLSYLCLPHRIRLFTYVQDRTEVRSPG